MGEEANWRILTPYTGVGLIGHLDTGRLIWTGTVGHHHRGSDVRL